MDSVSCLCIIYLIEMSSICGGDFVNYIKLEFYNGLYITAHLYIGTYIALDLYISWSFLFFSGLNK